MVGMLANRTGSLLPGDLLGSPPMNTVELFRGLATSPRGVARPPGVARRSGLLSLFAGTILEFLLVVVRNRSVHTSAFPKRKQSGFTNTRLTWHGSRAPQSTPRGCAPIHRPTGRTCSGRAIAGANAIRQLTQRPFEYRQRRSRVRLTFAMAVPARARQSEIGH